MCVFVCVCWVGRGAGPQYAGNVDAMAKWLRVTSLGYLAPEGLVEAATRSSGRPPPPLTHLVAGGPGPMADPAPMADAMRRWPASAGHSAGLSLPVGFGPVSDVWEVCVCGGGGGGGRGGGCRNAALLLPGVLYRRVPRPRIQGQGGLVKPGPQPSLLPARERCGGGAGVGVGRRGMKAVSRGRPGSARVRVRTMSAGPRTGPPLFARRRCRRRRALALS